MNLLPNHSEYQREILQGLMKVRKSISPKFLYDQRGSEIFEEICKLDEYYPVQAETEILKSYSGDMAARIGKNAIVIEPGCGNCRKVETLLQNLDRPTAYVALDISEVFLKKTTKRLQDQFPKVPVYSVVADYTRQFSLPLELKKSKHKRVIFFPGSTIGNLDPEEAAPLLRRMGKLLRKGGGLLIGVDMKKDAKTLELAYDDPQGVTAEFNYNLLDRLNREFSGSFDRKKFKYSANYNSQKGRVEMFLVSSEHQTVRIAEQSIHLSAQESIHTENSYKYAPKEFIELAEMCEFRLNALWMDERKRFCMYYFEHL